LAKVNARSRRVDDFCTVSTGLKAYQEGKGKPPQTIREKTGRVFHANKKIADTFGRYLDGVDVKRFQLTWSGEFLSYGPWLAEPRYSVPFAGPRLLIRQIPSSPPYCVNATYTDEKYYHDINSMVIFSPRNSGSLLALLGVINSRLISFWFLKTFDKFQRKIFPQFKVKELASFPVPKTLFANQAKVQHDRIVRIVQQMLDLNEQLREFKTKHECDIVQQQIDAINAQLDQLVYELYGLTDKEIAIVEEATAP